MDKYNYSIPHENLLNKEVYNNEWRSDSAEKNYQKLDKQGNWIEEIIHKKTESFGEAKYIPSSIIKRKIQYYKIRGDSK